MPGGLCVWPRICAGLQGRPGPLTILSVEADLSPVLLMTLQGLVQPLQGWLTGLWTIEETAAAGFLHDLSAAVACELAESVRAVDNGKAPWALCVGQQEVAVCGKKRSRLGQGQEGSLASRWAVPPPSCVRGHRARRFPGFHVIPGSPLGYSEMRVRRDRAKGQGLKDGLEPRQGPVGG